MKPGQIHESLKSREYYDGRIYEILGPISNDTLKQLRTLIYDAQTHCCSCGERRSADCWTCERLWSS